MPICICVSEPRAGGGLVRSCEPMLATLAARPAKVTMLAVERPRTAGTPNAPKPVATNATAPAMTATVLRTFAIASSYGLRCPIAVSSRNENI